MAPELPRASVRRARRLSMLERIRGLARAALGVETRVVLVPAEAPRRNYVERPEQPGSTPKTGTPSPNKARNTETYNSHPGYGLTVERIVSAFRSAEQGQPLTQFDLFDDWIERDGHLRGAISNRIESVSGRPWNLRPGGQDAGSVKAAADLENHLRNVLAFRDFIEHHLTAPHYGFAATSLRWDRIDNIVVPTWFYNHAHRRFAAPRDDRDNARVNEIEFIESITPMRQIPLEPGRWAVTRARGRNVWAAGSMRTNGWFATFKTWGGRDWQMFAEKFGLPLTIGYYQEGASPESRQALLDALANIGEDGYAVLSDLTEVIVKEAVRSGDAQSVWPAIIAWCNAEMSKLVSGGTLNADSGQAGSYALGTVHEARAYAFLLADAARVEEMFVRDIGTPFVAWNGYGGAKPPRLRMQVLRDVDPEKRARVISIAINELGLEVDEDQVREELELRPPTGEPLKGKPQPAPTVPGAKGAGGAGSRAGAEGFRISVDESTLGALVGLATQLAAIAGGRKENHAPG